MNLKNLFIFFGIFIILISINLVTFDKNFYLSQDNNLAYYEEEVDNLISFFLFQNFDTTKYSDKEITHLNDVRVLFLVSWLLILVLGLLHYYAYKKVQNKQTFIWKSCLASFTTIGILILGLLKFEKFFILFHKIFFINDNWLLPADSTLISLFPQTFFVAAFIRIILYSILLSSIPLIYYIIWRKNGK
jgi:integral membrane protein (TIGR01906 family)